MNEIAGGEREEGREGGREGGSLREGGREGGSLGGSLAGGESWGQSGGREAALSRRVPATSSSGDFESRLLNVAEVMQRLFPAAQVCVDSPAQKGKRTCLFSPCASPRQWVLARRQRRPSAQSDTT